ncbi:MAG: outer membrane beta-barrel protein [Bacteroidales bacterium]|nr:outer membrane beta-barrel protein [Bacteroidales bacterium]
MKNCKKHFVVALIVLMLGRFLAPIEAHAQIIEVGASAGLSYYMGDINPRKPFNNSSVGFGMLVRYYENTRWAFRLSYSYLQLKGSDDVSGYRPERGLSFKTNIHDIAAIAEFNFWDYFTGSKRNDLSPYLFGGISAFYFNPKAEDGTELCNMYTDVDYEGTMPARGEDKYSKFAISIPFGVGVKYSLGSKLGVAFEWRWDYTFTDWIDDCHAYYPKYNPGDDYVQYSDPTGFAADENGVNDKEYIQRGNKSDNDWFGYLNVSVVYKFVLPGGNDCHGGANKNIYKNY